VNTSFGGPPPKEGCSLLDPSIVSWFVMMTSFPLEESLVN
jgi:hypothetical protein